MGLIQPRTTWKTPEHAPQIYFDLFPTIVTFPDSPASTPYSKTRFILAAPPTPYVYVFKDGFQGVEATVFAEYDPEHIYGDTREGFDLILTAPAPTPVRMSIRPDANCGCGSALKGFRPFTNLNHTAAPTPRGPLAAFPTTPLAELYAPLQPEPATWG